MLKNRCLLLIELAVVVLSLVHILRTHQIAHNLNNFFIFKLENKMSNEIDDDLADALKFLHFSVTIVTPILK